MRLRAIHAQPRDRTVALKQNLGHVLKPKVDDSCRFGSVALPGSSRRLLGVTYNAGAVQICEMVGATEVHWDAVVDLIGVDEALGSFGLACVVVALQGFGALLRRARACAAR